MNDNRTKILIIIGAIIVVIGLIFFVLIKKNNISFYLVGENSINLSYGEIYSDPGFVATDGSGNDISGYVSITGYVNPYKVDVYELLYELNYNNTQEILSRIVVVDDMNIDDFEIIMNGEETVYLLRGLDYVDEGAYVLNKIDNTKIWDALEIDDEFNKDSEGEYYVTYSFKHNGIAKELKRKVIVFDIMYTITPANLTSEGVSISFDVSNLGIIKNIILPDGSIGLDGVVNYKVKENGDYVFKLLTVDGDSFEKTISVNNIISSYSCNGVIDRYGTTLNIISPSLSEVLKYEWNIDGEMIIGKSTYNRNKVVNSASVNLVLASGNHNVNCTIKDNLIYRFKYDEFFERPYISCNSYTEQDRLLLDAKLKAAIADAGKGTRAGVAEAGRFITGALDYKIRYLGPKKENFAVGRYPHVGLNIGKSDGWGCRVSGYVQGIDCTNFTDWVFIQNSLDINPFDGQNVEKSAVAYNKIRAGDLLLSPCPTYNGCWGTNFRHVGVVIGVDDKYIYAAEATTDQINAVVVTKWEKHNMPTSGKFSQVKFVKYRLGDGKYTDMWVS